MTALLQHPLDLGADLVVAADTKAPGGHSDLLFGHVAGRDAGLVKRLRDWRGTSGTVPGAMEAWLLHRGLETFEVRLERMCNSAEMIAQCLQEHPMVRRVRYPGLVGDPSYALSCRQMARFGFMIGMELSDAQIAESFIAACPYISCATSFGATHTSGERRARWGDAVSPGFVRLSIGVEPVEELWRAMDNALHSISSH